MSGRPAKRHQANPLTKFGPVAEEIAESCRLFPSLVGEICKYLFLQPLDAKGQLRLLKTYKGPSGVLAATNDYVLRHDLDDLVCNEYNGGERWRIPATWRTDIMTRNDKEIYIDTGDSAIDVICAQTSKRLRPIPLPSSLARGRELADINANGNMIFGRNDESERWTLVNAQGKVIRNWSEKKDEFFQEFHSPCPGRYFMACYGVLDSADNSVFEFSVKGNKKKKIIDLGVINPTAFGRVLIDRRGKVLLFEMRNGFVFLKNKVKQEVARYHFTKDDWDLAINTGLEVRLNGDDTLLIRTDDTVFLLGNPYDSAETEADPQATTDLEMKLNGFNPDVFVT